MIPPMPHGHTERRPEEWARRDGIQVLSRDGWRDGAK